MGKRYFNFAIAYGVIALISGVFYREFTKILGFTGKTNLSTIHTHYFALGMIFFLILALLEMNLSFSTEKAAKNLVILYQVGLNITGLFMLIRGLLQTWGTVLSKGMDAALSGSAGIGHIILGVTMIFLLVVIKKKVR